MAPIPAQLVCSSGDLFDAVLTPSDLVALISWCDRAVAKRASKTSLRFRTALGCAGCASVRDYSMFDRRKAPYNPGADSEPLRARCRSDRRQIIEESRFAP